MGLTKVTASAFQQSVGALSDKARKEPVMITKHGRDFLVLMAAEEWERLERGKGQVSLAAELPGQPLETVRSAGLPEEGARLGAEAAQRSVLPSIVQLDGPAASNGLCEGDVRISKKGRPTFAQLLLSAPYNLYLELDRVPTQGGGP